MKICVLPGDGIGPEIVAEAVRVLRALELPCELEEAQLGGCAVDATGSPFPEATQKLALAADAVLQSLDRLVNGGPSTGNYQLTVWQSPDSQDIIQASTATIPEPTSLMLGALGLAGLSLVRRRKA